MQIKESFLDKVHNKYLHLINKIRINILKTTKYGNDEPKNMKLIFSDDFQFFDQSKWRIGQPWGLFHPDFPYQYYGEKSVLVKNNKLILSQFLDPKDLTFGNDDKIYKIPQSVGLVTSYNSFGYGFYKFRINLPVGVGLWPAVWISCVDSWPPEIDILEAYSDKNSNYGQDLQSNFHYNIGQYKESSGARNHPVLSTEQDIVVSCYWTEDFIKIYYNGYLVRVITEKKTLEWFRGKKMLIILNNAIRPEYSNIIPDKQISEFIIYNVDYYEH